MWQHFQQHQLVPKPVTPQQKDNVSIVESPLMKCQGTGEICSLYLRVCYIKNLDLTNLWENKQNVHYNNGGIVDD